MSNSWLFGSASLKKELEKSRLNIEVLMQDLESKIEENAELHRTLSGIEEKHALELKELTKLNVKMEVTINDLKEEFEKSQLANEDQLLALRRQNNEYEYLHRKSLAEAETLRAKMQLLELEHSSHIQALNEDLKANRDQVSQKLQNDLHSVNGKLDQIVMEKSRIETELVALESHMESMRESLSQERLKNLELVCTALLFFQNCSLR